MFQTFSHILLHPHTSHIKSAVVKKYEGDMKIRFTEYSKLKNGPMVDENFAQRDYRTTMTMIDVRTNFRIRSKTIDVCMNQQSDKQHAKNLWKCSNCGHIDSQSHILWCPFLAPLREGKCLENNQHIVSYFQAALKAREEQRNTEN